MVHADICFRTDSLKPVSKFQGRSVVKFVSASKNRGGP